MSYNVLEACEKYSDHTWTAIKPKSSYRFQGIQYFGIIRNIVDYHNRVSY